MSDLALRIETEEGADDQELAQLAGKLRRELLHLDVDAVTHADGGGHRQAPRRSGWPRSVP